SAGVRSNLRAALVQEPGDGAVSRVCGRRGRNYGAPIRRRCRRVESRALERKTLSAERGGDFQPVVQEALLDLYKARIAALSHIGGRCGGGIQRIQRNGCKVFVFKLIAAGEESGTSGLVIETRKMRVNPPAEIEAGGGGRMQCGIRRSVLERSFHCQTVIAVRV